MELVTMLPSVNSLRALKIRHGDCFPVKPKLKERNSVIPQIIHYKLLVAF